MFRCSHARRSRLVRGGVLFWPAARKVQMSANITEKTAAPVRLEQAFPNSRKVYIEGRYGVRVPLREVALSGGEPPLRVYDTSGPQDIDVRTGMPTLRREW